MLLGSTETYISDPLNAWVELPAHLITFAAMCILLLSDHVEDIAATSGRQLYALAVLMQWARLLRPLQMSAEFGPVVLMVMRMLHDLRNFSVIFMVVTIAFSSSLFVLYKDPTQDPDLQLLAEMAPCFNYDAEFDQWHVAFITLIEGMLAQDGEPTCFRATSQPVCSAHRRPPVHRVVATLSASPLTRVSARLRAHPPEPLSSFVTRPSLAYPPSLARRGGYYPIPFSLRRRWGLRSCMGSC
jgi:hypothetical protein